MSSQASNPVVKIYQPAKTAMQSGKAKNKWIIEYIQTENKFVSPLTGWTGSEETELQIKLKFDSQEDAISYAKRKNLEYIVYEPNGANIIIKSYAEALTS